MLRKIQIFLESYIVTIILIVFILIFLLAFSYLSLNPISINLPSGDSERATLFVGLISAVYFVIFETRRQNFEIEKSLGSVQLSISSFDGIKLENVGDSPIKIKRVSLSSSEYKREDFFKMNSITEELDKNKKTPPFKQESILNKGEYLDLASTTKTIGEIEKVQLRVSLVEVIYETRGRRFINKIYYVYLRAANQWVGSDEERKRIEAIAIDYPNSGCHDNTYKIFRVDRVQI